MGKDKCLFLFTIVSNDKCTHLKLLIFDHNGCELAHSLFNRQTGLPDYVLLDIYEQAHLLLS